MTLLIHPGKKFSLPPTRMWEGGVRRFMTDTLGYEEGDDPVTVVEVEFMNHMEYTDSGAIYDWEKTVSVEFIIDASVAEHNLPILSEILINLDGIVAATAHDQEDHTWVNVVALKTDRVDGIMEVLKGIRPLGMCLLPSELGKYRFEGSGDYDRYGYVCWCGETVGVVGSGHIHERVGTKKAD